MSNSSYYRERAEQARRLALVSADPMLQVRLRSMADEYATLAEKLEEQLIVKDQD